MEVEQIKEEPLDVEETDVVEEEQEYVEGYGGGRDGGYGGGRDGGYEGGRDGGYGGGGY